MISCNVYWQQNEFFKPTKEGTYLVLAHSADENIPFCYTAWWNNEIKQWELIPKVWADVIEYWRELPIPEGFK